MTTSPILPPPSTVLTRPVAPGLISSWHQAPCAKPLANPPQSWKIPLNAAQTDGLHMHCNSQANQQRKKFNTGWMKICNEYRTPGWPVPRQPAIFFLHGLFFYFYFTFLSNGDPVFSPVFYVHDNPMRLAGLRDSGWPKASQGAFTSEWRFKCRSLRS